MVGLNGNKCYLFCRRCGVKKAPEHTIRKRKDDTAIVDTLYCNTCESELLVKS